MRRVMTINHLWELPHIQGVIVAGTNTEFDLVDRRVIERLLIGREVVVTLANGAAVRALPTGLNISESLVGKKNILLTMPTSLSKTDLVIGTDVLMDDEV